MKAFLILLSLTMIASPSRGEGMDLHSHLFLEHGVPSWFYKGCFTCPLGASDWSSLRGTKANEETLLNSKLNLVVVALHSTSIGIWDRKESIRRQIAALNNFLETHPDWILAKSAAVAADAIKKKKQIMVVSLEGADGVLEDENDIKEFILKGPISIVTPLHLTDDEFGGAAFLYSFRGFLNFKAFVKNIWTPNVVDGVRVNELGLTPRGEWLLNKLVDARVWVDFTHASDVAQKQMSSLTSKTKQPLLYTHTVLREYHGAERGLSKSQIEEIRKTGGFVGLLPSRNYLNGTPNYECDLRAFFNHYKKLSDRIGRNSVTIGSDFNAPLEHLAPGCGDDQGIDKEGFWREDQISDLWKKLNEFQVGIADPKGQVTQFLKVWAKVR
jgi:microsomal dipeptidase-like Zn-dependent dipeptidase